MKDKQEWFASWFNSPYYHELYSHRNWEEAALFIQNLVGFLDIPKGSSILDLACGNGRHVRALSEMGFDAKGMDLAANSIADAQEQGHQAFFVGDMRDPFPVNQLDYVFNLFTSFGYFDSLEENEKVLNNIHASLKPGAWVVIDFLNAEKVIANLVAQETISKQGVDYHIARTVENGIIQKNIRFTSREGEQWDVTEKVEALTLSDFSALFEKTGFQMRRIFGSLNLEPFQEETSNRLILLAQKK